MTVEENVIRVLLNKGYKIVVCKNEVNPTTLEKVKKITGEYNKPGYIDLTAQWQDHFDKYYGMSEDDLCEEFKVTKIKRGNLRKNANIVVQHEVDMEESRKGLTLNASAVDISLNSGGSNAELSKSNMKERENTVAELQKQLWEEFINLKKETLSMENSLYTLLNWKSRFQA